MSSNEENTEMKMNCNMACKSNQNLNKQMRCSSWYLLNTQNLLQYKPIKERGFLNKCVTTDLSEVGDFISIKCVTHLNKYSIHPAHS